jgi:hypothetical protein
LPGSGRRDGSEFVRKGSREQLVNVLRKLLPDESN